MDRREAQFILQAYRPNHQDRTDPLFAEALAMVEKDPELAVWFSEQQAFSQALSDKMKEIKVPNHLLSDTLAAGKVTSLKPQFKTKRWLALAAAVIVSSLLSMLWMNRFTVSGEENFAAFRVDMGNYMSRIFFLDYTSENHDEIRKWLDSKHGITDELIPAVLAKYPSVGCEIISWHDDEVVLICFDVNGELVHLFTLPNKVFADAPRTERKVTERVGKWETASWSQDGRLYLITTEGSKSLLKKAVAL